MPRRSIRRTKRTILTVVLAASGFIVPRVHAQADADAPIAAVGDRVRLVLRIPEGEPSTAERNRDVEGLVLRIDSASVTLKTGDSSRTVARSAVEKMQTYAGRSHWWGVVAGWVVSLPFALFECRNATHECDEGGVVELMGAIVGAAVGWPRWKDMRFP